jgi:hypothetical protein
VGEHRGVDVDAAEALDALVKPPSASLRNTAASNVPPPRS